jgi:hypothetical protein
MESYARSTGIKFILSAVTYFQFRNHTLRTVIPNYIKQSLLQADSRQDEQEVAGLLKNSNCYYDVNRVPLNTILSHLNPHQM